MSGVGRRGWSCYECWQFVDSWMKLLCASGRPLLASEEVKCSIVSVQVGNGTIVKRKYLSDVSKAGILLSWPPLRLPPKEQTITETIFRLIGFR